MVVLPEPQIDAALGVGRSTRGPTPAPARLAGIGRSADGLRRRHHPDSEHPTPPASYELDGGAVSESELEQTGTGSDAKRIGQAPTTTDVTDPERSSRNTAAGSGSEPGEGPVQPDADEGVDPAASIEPHNEGLV
jgi:hypothetical protein